MMNLFEVINDLFQNTKIGAPPQTPFFFGKLCYWNHSAISHTICQKLENCQKMMNVGLSNKAEDNNKNEDEDEGDKIYSLNDIRGWLDLGLDYIYFR